MYRRQAVVYHSIKNREGLPPPLKFHFSNLRQASKLKSWGLAGVMAYGFLNTFYYSIAFIVWH